MLSEKPAAPTLAQAEQLLTFYQSLPQASFCLWAHKRRLAAPLPLQDTFA